MPSPEHPSWLSALLADTRPPPKLFAWSPANLDSPTAVKPGRADRGDIGPGRYAVEAPITTASEPVKRIYIVGPGNVGRLYASYMSRQRNALPITLVVHRKELLSQWVTSEGVVLADRGGKVTKNKQFDVEWWTESRPRYGPVREVADGEKLHNVFISTKANAGLGEADRLRRYLGRCSSVVFAQNGVSKLWAPYGPLYVASRYHTEDAPSFSACVVNHGISAAGLFYSIHTSPSDAFIGPIFKGSAAPAHGQNKRRRLDDDFFTTYISSTPFLDTKHVSSGQLWIIQLEKLVLNAAINPLTTLLRCKTGQLFASYDSHDALTRVLDQLLWQASAVIQALINHDANIDMMTSYAETVHRLVPGSDDYGRKFANIRRKLTVRFSQPILKAKLYAFGLKILVPVPLNMHIDKEIGTAKASAELRVPFTLSTSSTTGIEELVEAYPESDKWFQLYWPLDKEITASILSRAKKNGFKTLVATLGGWTVAWRLSEFDTANIPFLVSVGHILRKYWDGPIVVKGVLSFKDAKLAVHHGLDGTICQQPRTPA
ncbi:putative lactate 2-monooxygenase PB1A11.03 [Beauveria bassiana D1-5]|uniref:Putative lactate 2-monooxygenase PB1A11.03 n=1 Tax=Beauveria bassiana D1-5 TaxID=1245745 RepID=A0A0A2W014_BEABA|nr:putative lactate 2-monooxygenase PB1A11.03 [Beauveria bassiana D1-5]